MIHLHYFHQRTGYTCGPAAMKMVFDFFGIKVGEKKLKRLLRSNKNKGTTHKRLIAIALKNGFYCYVHNNSLIHDIKSFIDRDLPVIVHYVEPEDNEEHYSVVIGYKRNKLVMNDPWAGKHFKIKISDFEKRWHGVKKKRWIMVISKKPFDIGKQFIPKREIKADSVS